MKQCWSDFHCLAFIAHTCNILMYNNYTIGFIVNILLPVGCWVTPPNVCWGSKPARIICACTPAYKQSKYYRINLKKILCCFWSITDSTKNTTCHICRCIEPKLFYFITLLFFSSSLLLFSFCTEWKQFKVIVYWNSILIG